MKIKPYIQKYLNANQTSAELESNENLSRQFENVIVIPILAEYETFPSTWQRLTKALAIASPTLVLVVVNNPPITAANKMAVANNQLLLKKLRQNSFSTSKNGVLAWIDASSPGCEIRPDHGVGGARKLGMDSALQYLNFNCNPLIFSLDADTLVESDYLTSPREFFCLHPEIIGIILNFKHQLGKTPEEEKAIRIYEKFMDSYVAGLRQSPTPYAYHAIGSAIVCRAESYIKAGGMRARPAGEDFYFLQALCKCGKPPRPVQDFSGTCVFPSARPSERVPFGTGPQIKKIIQKMKTTDNPAVFYNPQIYKILANIFTKVASGDLEKSLDGYLDSLPAEAQGFMDKYEFRKSWSKIIKNTPDDSEKIIWAFHTWFDAFKILKFIHFCEQEPYNYQRVRG